MRLRKYKYTQKSNLAEKLKYYFEYKFGISEDMGEQEVFLALNKIIDNHKDMDYLDFTWEMDRVIDFCSKKIGEETSIVLKTTVSSFMEIYDLMKKEVEEYNKLKTKTKRRISNE